MTVRTRFAPSPTGYLHIGGARTALYSWLYARAHEGVFILRIEDTDLERSTPEAVQAIIEGMAWLGLDWDEGPYYQTKHFDRYRAVVNQLLQTGHAYRCYCTKERLDELRARQQAEKQKPRYDHHCRDLGEQPSLPFVVRFKNPLSGNVVFDDQVYGTISVANTELDDLIIARTDGTPTYNFTVVVDDWDMKITHVIRGDDHINNTPRQINILEALGATPPVYAHLPMILGKDGKRFSKRHGAVSVLHYREQGYLPKALINYLVRLGWAHGDQELFSREEMIAHFSLKAVNKSAAAFDPDKLNWVNKQYLKQASLAELTPLLEQHLQALGLSVAEGPAVSAVWPVYSDRVNTLHEFAEKTAYLYTDEMTMDAAAVTQHLTAESIVVLQAAQQQLQALPEWTVASIQTAVDATLAQTGVKMPKLAQPLRVALTGNTSSPGISDTLFLLGKERTLARLAAAIA
jgi:glutamyl-tRNA synthetase